MGFDPMTSYLNVRRFYQLTISVVMCNIRFFYVDISNNIDISIYFRYFPIVIGWVAQCKQYRSDSLIIICRTKRIGTKVMKQKRPNQEKFLKTQEVT